jgi:hypothetical protein
MRISGYSKKQTSRDVTIPSLLRGDPQMPSATLDPQQQFTCAACQHVMRVAGLGRHAVYFELTDTLLDHPVMDRVCAQCQAALPGKKAS